MASARDGSNPARENMKQFHRFQELYGGRFSTKQAVVILEKFKYDAGEAYNFLTTATDDEVKQLIKDEEESADLVDRVRNLSLSGSLLEVAKHGQINSTMRQFSCVPCDRVWWRKTPERKQVSKCNRCSVRYDPVPRDQEWGWAQFECQTCAHKFSGFCAMTNTSPCYQCHSEVAPFCINPPIRKRGPRRSDNAHRCDAPDCSGDCSQTGGTGRRGNRAGSRGRGRRATREGRADGSQVNSGETGHEEGQAPPQPAPCVHPSSRRAQSGRKVIFPSQPHDSSGSTVDTFLTQADFDGDSRAGSPLPPINENK